MFTLGAQLYTVRHKTQTLPDFSETLARVASMGYTTVQVSGTCPFPAEWLAAELKKNGLVCAITHTSPDRIVKETETVIREHEVFGCDYIGLGGTPGGIDTEGGYARLCSIVDAAGRSIAAAGKKLMYHNHDHEFARETKNGKPYLLRLADDYGGDILGFTLDTYWVQAGGATVTSVIRALSGRLDCVHLKDMTFDHGMKMAPIGSGNMDFEPILSELEKAGTKFALVEQDDCYDDDPFDCLKQSYAYLSSLGLK